MRLANMFWILISLTLLSCAFGKEKKDNITSTEDSISIADTLQIEVEGLLLPVEVTPEAIVIRKEFLYDKYTLEDVYPYKDTTRFFQWDQIKKGLARIETLQQEPITWGVLQNRKNSNGVPPLNKLYSRNDYDLIVDTFGIPRYEGIPLYALNDTLIPERYATDGSVVVIRETQGSFTKVSSVYLQSDWYIPAKYVNIINPDTALCFNKIAFVDRKNQNIATLEKNSQEWLVRSMNPVTTGRHHPPYSHPTPLGIFAVQNKQVKMVFLKDGSTETGGFAPFASRFCNGAYIHGVPVNEPASSNIEFSSTLGTIPRSHMCVRNATSHAEFVYHWAPVFGSLVFVLE